MSEVPAVPVSRPVKVVIVDDTRSIRMMIRELLSRSPRIKVVGEAGDPYEARDLIREVNPDVVTLDIVMPRMDGLSFLEKIMRLRPMPVVMVSSRTQENSREAIRALELGAVDCIDRAMLSDERRHVDLVERVLTAAESNVAAISASTVGAPASAEAYAWNGKAVLIGSSTGGVDALMKVIGGLPGNCAPCVIAQHMPKEFLESFTARLDRHCTPEVRLASDGARLLPGRVLVAPGGEFHAALQPDDRRCIRLIRDHGEQLYVPSVNVLFSSAVPHAKHMIGVMLTGMGSDGAEAMLRMRTAGACTIVQDGASSVVDGMPRSAREIGAAMDVAPLNRIAELIIKHTNAGEAEDT